MESNTEETTRVVLCSYPSIFTDIVLNKLLKTEQIDVVGIVYSTRVFSENENFVKVALKMIKQSGISYALMQFLQTDVYCFLKTVFQTKRFKVPIFQTKNINHEQSLKLLKELNADIILLAHFNQKVSKQVIESAKCNCINLHPSLLPDYKGIDPVFAALFAQEKQLGVTIHEVDEKLDTGDILLQQSIDSEPTESVFQQQIKLFEIGANLAAQIIQTQQFSHKHPQVKEGRYDSWPKKKQITSFIKQDNKLITLKDFYHAFKNL